ncbi:hypothetical protein V1503_24020 [Bacillus sp. SCS-151]|uniref:hypothetical protein n=1 Tax=Nanhaiella sioensis TaxID=3115293 RepID=UPI00397AF9B4
MKSKKNSSFKIAISTFLGLTLFSTSAFAWSNSNNNDYWFPYTGSFSVSKDISSTTIPTIDADLNFKFNTSQANLIHANISYYPTFDVRDDSKGAFDGNFITTNLPDPKYDYEDDNDDGFDDELEVIVKSQWDVEANKSYYVDTGWIAYSEINDPALISYASVSVAPFFPGGDYNTVAGTSKYLGGVKWSQMSTNKVSVLSPAKNNSRVDFNAVNNSESIMNFSSLKKQDSEYPEINSKDSLGKYKTKSHGLIKELKNNEEYSFVITLDQPISIEDFYDLSDSYDIEITQLNARAIDQNDDKVTIGTNKIEDDVLNQIKENESYDFSGIVEMKGIGTGKYLKDLLKDERVFIVEVESEGNETFGLYWNHEKFNLK